MEKSFANKNKRYRITRGNSIASLEKGNSFTNISASNALTTVKSVPAVSFKLVIALIVAVVFAVVTAVILAVVLTSNDKDGDKLSGAPDDGKTTSRIVTTTSGQETHVSTTISSSSSPTTTNATTDNLWGPWGEWTDCTSMCDSGIHKRYRNCNAQESADCLGDYVETDMCIETACPVYGKWTTWAPWESCNVTCGGGTQSRIRSCSKRDPSDIDCVGRSSQTKACAEWQCPDCSRACSSGILNDDCDTCMCDDALITGRVCVADTGLPVSYANFYVSTAPSKLVAQSNSTGFFTLENLCTDTELLVTKSGFLDNTVSVQSEYFIVNMTKQILPYLTETPQAKKRLVGEDVILCCQAVARPSIDYFEWFKDGIILNENPFQDGNKLSLSDLKPSDGGSYQCRANSPVGAIMSPTAALNIKEAPDDFCSDSLQQKTIALPENCVQARTNTATYEVGECISNSCRGNTTSDSESCREDITTCCTTGEAELKKVQCSGFELEVVVVKSCSCGTCFSNSLSISGTAFGVEDGSPLRFGEVWLNGVFHTYTSASGNFNIDVSKSSSRVTLNLKDVYFRQFLQAVKVIDIDDQMSGVLRVEIPMIQSSEPVKIDSSIENTLVAGSSENNESLSIIKMIIPANAFYYSNGTQYSGTVDASLTFLDPTNSSVLENMPGTFEIVDEEGELADLDSLGVFSLYFEDSFGQALVLNEAIDFYLPPDAVEDADVLQEIKLWMINTETGVWEYVAKPTGTRRRKRQVNIATWIGELDLSSSVSQTWYNYDAIRRRTSACFFKVRLFQDETALATISNTRKMIHVQTHILKGNLLTTVKSYMRNPENQCMTGICEGNNAFISLHYYGRKGTHHLFANTPAIGQKNHFYQIIDDNKILKIQMSASNDGPFFSNEAQCRASPSKENHLKFYYGPSNEIFTFLTFFDLPGPGFDLDSLRYKSLRTWYPVRIPEGYRICFMKVRIIFPSAINLSDGQYIKLKATSYGGTYSETKDFIFGIRQYDVLDLVDTTFCVEYKCSGTIDPVFDEQLDYTRVLLEVVYPTSNVMTEITDEADFVTSYPDLMNRAQLGSNDGLYEIIAPTVYTPELGLYSATSDRLEIDSATNTAEGECRSGKPHNLKDKNPDIGVAVTVTISEVNPCDMYWWWMMLYDC